MKVAVLDDYQPLLQLDNVVLTPHLGWPTDTGFRGFAEMAVENILNYMDGKLTHAVNPEALERRSQGKKALPKP